MKRKDVLASGGWGLFDQYSTLLQALQSVYPQFNWDSARFDECARQRIRSALKPKLMGLLDLAEMKLGIVTVTYP